MKNSFNNLYNKIVSETIATANNQQNSSNTQPTPPSTGNNAKLDTKALAAQIAELDPTKIDPKHQELLTALQQVLVKPTQPISSNAANQQTNQTQK